MPDSPFAHLTAKARRQAALMSLRDRLLRPLRPARIDARREGPANLLLIGVDTLRADHLGAYGYGRPTSPNLDRLGGGGTVFTDVTAPAPWTLPSFSSALTGRMPGLHGAYLPGAMRNMDSQAPRRLDPDILTLAGHLHGQGYRTAAFYSNQFFAFGLAESFDVHRYLNLPAAELCRCALEWIRRHADRPFFCFVLLNDPHEPTTPQPEDLAPFLPTDTDPALVHGLARWGEAPAPELGRLSSPLDETARRALELKLAIYDGTIHEVDRAIGGLWEQIGAWGLQEKTLMSVFSDHGEEFCEHAHWAARWDHDPRGIRGIGHGHCLFGEVLSVPWLAWGAGVPGGRRRRGPAGLLDLSPTLLDWLGLPPLPEDSAAGLLDGALVGRSLAGGVAAADRVVLSEAIAYGPDLVTVRRGRWKLIAHRDGRPLALFDLGSDPGETTDAAAGNPEMLAELHGILEAWRRTGRTASGDDQGTGWQDMDETIRQRLKDLGYAE